MDLLRLRDELGTELGSKFNRIYQESLQIWGNPLLPKFTTHGRRHTEQVEANLDALTRPLQKSDKPLTEDEIFVLLAGTCLHDIGMQLVDDPNARANHAAASRNMILFSSDQVPIEQRRITLSIEDKNAREAIAQVAQAHWIDYALGLPPYPFIHENKPGRLRLLGLLLAMADLLDMSPVRAHYFRSTHRLYDLEPESELHHVKHDFVKGCFIAPANNDVPGALQFKLQWRGKKGLVRILNDWVMQSFNCHWRQIQGALYEESRGSIGWAKPWAHVIFHEPLGPPTKMSPEAENFLKAERAEQIRIDREAFARRFREALSNREAAVFLFPAESDFYGRWVRKWCEAYARSQNNCQVANIEVRSDAVPQFASIIGQILLQWDRPAPVYSNEEAAAFLDSFLRLDDSPNLVTIIKTDEPIGASLENLLRMLILRNSDAARVCVLICPKAKGPGKIGDASIIEFDGSIFSREEIEEHLQKKHGFSARESRRIYYRMKRIKLTEEPARVYTYIEDHCGA